MAYYIYDTINMGVYRTDWTPGVRLRIPRKYLFDPDQENRNNYFLGGNSSFSEIFHILGSERPFWRKHFQLSLRLEIYVFGNLVAHRMGLGGLLIRI
jgi:hypothetical protein